MPDETDDINLEEEVESAEAPEEVNLESNRRKENARMFKEADLQIYSDFLSIPVKTMNKCGKLKNARLLFYWDKVINKDEAAIEEFCKQSQQRIGPWVEQLYTEGKVIATIETLDEYSFYLHYKAGKSKLTKEMPMNRVLVETEIYPLDTSKLETKAKCLEEGRKNYKWKKFYLDLIKVGTREIVAIPHWPCNKLKKFEDLACIHHIKNPAKRIPEIPKFFELTDEEQDQLKDFYMNDGRVDLSSFSPDSLPAIQRLMTMCDNDPVLLDSGRRVLNLANLDIQHITDERVKDLMIINLAMLNVRKDAAMRAWIRLNEFNENHELPPPSPPDLTKDTETMTKLLKELGFIGKVSATKKSLSKIIPA